MKVYNSIVMNNLMNKMLAVMETDKPDDIKRGSDGEYYVEKVIKMHLKEGREEFLVKWIGYPFSEATWEPFENLSGQEACEYLDIFTFTIT